MARANSEVADLLQEYADLLRISGGDQFRARNYEKAAKSVAGYSGDVGTLSEADLRKIPGVGQSIAAKIIQYRRTGTITELEDLRASVPDGVRALTSIPALGPRRALRLYHELGISSIDELAAAIEADRLHGLKGFGARSEERLRRGIEIARSATGRTPLHVATEVAGKIVTAVRAAPGCQRCEPAGSLRRFAATVGDVDVLAAAADSAPLMAALTRLPEVTEVIVHGTTKTSVRVATGHPAQGGSIQVDLRVVRPECWGAALQYFTGSRAHNVAVREIAVRAKLKLSEYGLFDAETGDLIVSTTEEEVYARLGMAWVPPPMREDTGEVKAALRGELPQLVRLSDIRGDLHTHTNLTDGVATLAEMVAAGRSRGFEYYAITDHAPKLFMQRMTTEKILAQREQVRRLEESLAADGTPMRLLHGTELNIAADGSVDWPDEVLAGFDIRVASVHSHFDQPRDEMTRRFVRACQNPYVNVIGHPTARRIGKRPGVDVDFAELFRACAQTGTALEINSHPERLDLPAEHIRAARDAGVKFAIDTDAHATGHLDFLRYGVGTAQRGWLTADDVINTWPLNRLTTFLRKDRPGG
jgi:DNA polymerase (family 10)